MIEEAFKELKQGLRLCQPGHAEASQLPPLSHHDLTNTLSSHTSSVKYYRHVDDTSVNGFIPNQPPAMTPHGVEYVSNTDYRLP